MGLPVGENIVVSGDLQPYASSITIFARWLLRRFLSHASILFLSVRRSPLRGTVKITTGTIAERRVESLTRVKR